MIWGGAARQHTWLAIGARTFALLSLVMPLIIGGNQLLLLALLATGAVWAAVTAGELLGPPAPPVPAPDAALPRLPPARRRAPDPAGIGSIAGLSSPSPPASHGAMAVPPFTAGLSRGI